MKITFAFFLFILLTNHLFSQDGYEIINENADFSNNAIQIGFGLETDFDFRTDLLLTGNYHHYFDNIPLELNFSSAINLYSERKKEFFIANKTDNEFQGFSFIDIGGIWNIKQNVAEKEVDVKLKQERVSSSTNLVTVIPTPTTVINSYGMRFGIHRYGQSLMSYDAVDKNLQLDENTSLPDVENPWWSSSTESKPDEYFTAERHLSGYLGFNYGYRHGVGIEVEGYGKRRSYKDVSIYADVLFDIASDLQKMSYNGQLYDLTKAISGVDQSTVGYRIGVKYIGSVKGYFARMEVGQRPQYLNSKIHFNLTFGASLHPSK